MNIYELIGIILGDGYIGHNKKARRAWLQITGNAHTDKEYFDEIASLIYSLTGKKPLIYSVKDKKGKSLRLDFNNKKFVDFLINNFGLHVGNKTYTAKLPNSLLQWNYFKHIVRGIFDTDGSLYFSMSKKTEYPTYPRLEIKTSSTALANQIMGALKDKGFVIHSFPSKSDRTIRIYLGGEKMLEKWVKEIGFTNQNGMKRYLYWKKRGYYIPPSGNKSCTDATAATGADF